MNVHNKYNWSIHVLIIVFTLYLTHYYWPVANSFHCAIILFLQDGLGLMMQYYCNISTNCNTTQVRLDALVIFPGVSCTSGENTGQYNMFIQWHSFGCCWILSLPPAPPSSSCITFDIHATSNLMSANISAIWSQQGLTAEGSCRRLTQISHSVWKELLKLQGTLKSQETLLSCVQVHYVMEYNVLVPPTPKIPLLNLKHIRPYIVEAMSPVLTWKMWCPGMFSIWKIAALFCPNATHSASARNLLRPAMC